MAKMTRSDIKEFNFDSRTIDWPAMMLKFNYGIRRFHIKEQCEMPVGEYRQYLRKNKVPFGFDIRVANKSANSNFIIRKNVSMFFPVV